MDAPFFVIGSGRSGTTLLRLMLDSHPRLAVPPESEFVVWAYRRRRHVTHGAVVDAKRLLSMIRTQPSFAAWELPADALAAATAALPARPSLADVLAVPFAAYAAQAGKSRWGDKTPWYVFHVDAIRLLWPEARFVHLVRDPREVVASYVEQPFGPSSIRAAALMWVRRTRAALAAGERLGPERYLELRYERLVADPEAELRSACAFLDEGFAPEMLEYHRTALERVPAGQRDAHRALAAPPTPELRDWRRDLAPADLRRIEEICGDLMRRLGYAPSSDRGPGIGSAILRAGSLTAAATRRGAAAAAAWVRP